MVYLEQASGSYYSEDKEDLKVSKFATFTEEVARSFGLC